MADVSVRDLDDEVRDRLKVRAAEHGRSMEAEIREILTDAVMPRSDTDLFDEVRARARALGGVELEPADRPDHPRGVPLS